MAEQYLTINHLSIKDITRIFSKIKIDPDTQCWIWQAATHRGYGILQFRGEASRAHRLIYAWLVAPVPRWNGKDTLVIDHLVCSNASCVNPAHMALVSTRTNVLRSNAPTARNARKTHCKRGHPFEGDNMLLVANGRACYTCRLEYDREAKRKKHTANRKPRKPPTPKSHCKQGHPLTPETIYLKPSGGRQCRICVIKRKTQQHKDKLANDPEYREKRRQYDREYKRRRYAGDPEYRERRKRQEQQRAKKHAAGSAPPSDDVQ